VRRREFIPLLGGAAVWPLAARAQQPAMPVVGFLSSAFPDRDAGRLRAFRQGLSESGYVEGRNVAIEYRWAEERNDRLPALAADLVSRRVAVIATAGQILAAFAAKAATTTIPVVFLTGANPVDVGLVASLNRPGGNLTGVTTLSVELEPKRLELLRGVMPTATSIGALVNRTNPNAEIQSRELQSAARALGLELQILDAVTEHDFDTVFAKLVELKAGGDRDRRAFHQPGRGAGSADCSPRAARDLPVSRVRRRWRVDELRWEPRGNVSPVRGLHWPHPQGRETGRPSGTTVHEGRAGDQPQDRQDAWPRGASDPARPR
jgi:hypothetical protein